MPAQPMFSQLVQQEGAVTCRTPVPEKRSGEQRKGGEGECLSKQSISGDTSNVSERVTFFKPSK